MTRRQLFQSLLSKLSQRQRRRAFPNDADYLENLIDSGLPIPAGHYLVTREIVPGVSFIDFDPVRET